MTEHAQWYKSHLAARAHRASLANRGVTSEIVESEGGGYVVRWWE
jgi:hypothetical protein